MSEVKRFWNALRAVTVNEAFIKQSKEELDRAYPELVETCPHGEAIQYNHNLRGKAAIRVCKTCGVEDHGIIGQTPGDEYDYGFAGTHDREFWKDTELETTTDHAYFAGFRKGHGFRVVNGKAQK